MKYYLGNKTKNDNYEPIDLSGVIENPENINSVYNYVFGFNNYQELVEDLFNRGLIDSKNTNLAYCSIYHGKLKPLFNGTTMYFKDAKDFFSVYNIRLFLYDNQYDLDLVEYLFVSEIRKYRIVDNLKKSFLKTLSNKEAFKAHLEYLSKRGFSPEFKQRFKELSDYVDKYNISSLKKDGIFMGMVNATLTDICNSDEDLLCLFNSESKGHTPTSIDLLTRLHRMVREENAVGQYLFETTPDEDNNVREVIDNFIREEVTNKQKDGSRKSSPRKLIDLAMLLYKYQNRKNDKQIEEFIEDEIEPDETYYEEDDFVREGISIEDLEDYGFYKTNPDNPEGFYRRK